MTISKIYFIHTFLYDCYDWSWELVYIDMIVSEGLVDINNDVY